MSALISIIVGQFGALFLQMLSVFYVLCLPEVSKFHELFGGVTPANGHTTVRGPTPQPVPASEQLETLLLVKTCGSWLREGAVLEVIILLFFMDFLNGGMWLTPSVQEEMPWKPVHLWMIVGKPTVHFLDWWLIRDCGQYHICASGPGCYKKPGEKAMRSKPLSSIPLWPLYHFLSLGFCPVWVLDLTTLSDRLACNCKLK